MKKIKTDILNFKAEFKEQFHSALIFSAFVGLLYFGLLDNGRGPAYPEILRSLDLNNRQGSWLFAITSFLSFIMTVLSHKWLVKLDLKRAMRLGWLLLSLASLCIGLSGTFHSSPLLFGASIIQGIGMGFVGMTMNLMIETGAPVSHRRRTFSALHATYGIASLVAPLLFTGVKLIGLHWEHFFYALALLGPVLFYLAPRCEPVYAKIPEPDLHFKLPLGFLLLLGVTIGCYVASEIVVSSRLVLFLEEGRGLSNSEASFYLSAFFLCLMGGRLFMGIKDLPIKGSTLLIASLSLSLGLLFLGHMGFLFCFSLTGLTMSVFFPSFMDWLAETFPNDFQKTTTFVLSGIGLHLVAMHLGFGSLAEALGVEKAMGLSSALTFTSLILLIISLIWVRHLKNRA